MTFAECNVYSFSVRAFYSVPHESGLVRVLRPHVLGRRLHHLQRDGHGGAGGVKAVSRVSHDNGFQNSNAETDQVIMNWAFIFIFYQ